MDITTHHIVLRTSKHNGITGDYHMGVEAPEAEDVDVVGLF